MIRIKNRGFTLLELLVVISIIGILVAMGAVSYSAAQAKGRNAKRRGDLKAWAAAMEQAYATASPPAYPAPAGCSPGATYFAGGVVPKDPKTNAVYSTFCSATEYCICAQLEPATATDGNANGVGAASGCAVMNAGSGSAFCVKSQQ